MDPRRLVKIALPAKLVDAMDRAIDRQSGYEDRAEFIADAISSLIAELEVDDMSQPSAAPRTVDLAFEALRSPARIRGTSGRTMRLPNLGGPEQAELSLSSPELPEIAIVAPPFDVPVTPVLPSPASKPTWGLHNRDWPTLWVASELGRASLRGPIDFESWVGEVVMQAGLMAERYQGPAWDLSGLPSTQKKPEHSAARFRSWFVGDNAGDGPLFSLGLAAATEQGTVLLTRPGEQLLRDLSGLEPRRGPIRPNWRAAFLSYLAAWVPEDFLLLRSIVRHIEEGRAGRLELGEAIAAEYEWKDSLVSTYVAGYVGRGREWNVIERSQAKRRYSNVADAIDVLDQAFASGERIRNEHADEPDSEEPRDASFAKGRRIRTERA